MSSEDRSTVSDIRHNPGPDRTGLQIALTHPTCWPEVRRGSERFLHEFSHFLAARGHQVTVISTVPSVGGVEDNGLVRRLLLPRTAPFRLQNRWFGFTHGFACKLVSVLRSGSYDVVHCLHYHDACGAAFARRLGAGFRLVYQLTGIPPRRYFCRVPLDGLIFHAAVRNADAVLAPSRYAQTMLRRRHSCAARLLPPGTDIRPFAVLDRPHADGAARILFAGDLDEPRKGALLLAKAFALLCKDQRPACLEYSGRASPTIRATILDAVPETVRPRIAFLGVGEVEDLPNIFARATVVVNPAVSEALGMVLVEALAAGTPVVGCDHAGTPDVIDDPRIGCLFDPGSTRPAATNVEGLADAIRRAIRLAARPETAALCRARADFFSWERIGTLYEGVLCGT